jgi:hypothetical protein
MHFSLQAYRFKRHLTKKVSLLFRVKEWRFIAENFCPMKVHYSLRALLSGNSAGCKPLKT